MSGHSYRVVDKLAQVQDKGTICPISIAFEHRSVCGQFWREKLRGKHLVLIEEIAREWWEHKKRRDARNFNCGSSGCLGGGVRLEFLFYQRC